ncbi:MAG TPA: hypothetical protein VEY50_11355 [Lysobacter sp.]|nr:hypothetical protein [Lysobacter sp.]
MSRPNLLDLRSALVRAWHGSARTLSVGVLLGLLAACATKPPKLPEPLRAPNPPTPQGEVLQGPGEPTRPRIEEGPTQRPLVPQKKAEDTEIRVPEVPAKQPVSLVLDGVPISAFINVVFGTELGFSLEIEQAVRDRPELVSLRVTEPQPPDKIYRIAAEVLRNYGIQIREVGGLLRFSPMQTASGGVPKVLVTRALPDVPAGQRTVFAAVPLDASEPGRVAAQVRSLLGNKSVTLIELIEANALLISGPGESVQAAMEAVLTLDRSALRDKRSIRINPLYLSVDQLAAELREVLAAQGFTVRTGPGTAGALTFVPVQSANALIVFSESEPALRAVTEWAERLDQPANPNAGGGGVFMYAARHTTVESLLPVLQTLVGGTTTGAPPAATPPATGTARGNNEGGQAPRSTANRTVTMGGAAGQLAVDPIRNVIVYQGDGQRWRAIQGVLARLDQPARQVVIEVTIAEVTLTDEFSHGIEWALRNIEFEGMSGPLTALRGNQPNTGGLVWRALSSSGQVSALVNLFARDRRVSILSTPRLLVKSGETASIDVGTEVPVITSQATAPDLPNPGDTPSVLQSIQYRKTGVLLELEAVVHSGQRVDLKLSQEVSEASPNEISDISSPSIFSRRLQTSLTLSDGESMLLGGLISSSNSDGKSKVPLLGDIPVVGRLFQNRLREGTKTELLMLITPYVVEDATQARAITDAIRARFGTGQDG